MNFHFPNQNLALGECFYSFYIILLPHFTFSLFFFPYTSLEKVTLGNQSPRALYLASSFQDHKWHHLSGVKSSPSLHIPEQFIICCNCDIQQSSFLQLFLNHLRQEQCTPETSHIAWALLCFPSADIRLVSVTHEGRGFQLSEGSHTLASLF